MKKLILALFVLAISMSSCSDDSATNNDTTTTPLARTLPIANVIFTVQADYIQTIAPGVFEVGVRVYMTITSEGQTYLIASATCQVNSTNSYTGGCLGGFRGDAVTHDDHLDGQCIRELFTDNPNIYSLYITARNRAIAGH